MHISITPSGKIHFPYWQFFCPGSGIVKELLISAKRIFKNIAAIFPAKEVGVYDRIVT
jgi:hypothetical protein